MDRLRIGFERARLVRGLSSRASVRARVCVRVLVITQFTKPAQVGRGPDVC